MIEAIDSSLAIQLPMLIECNMIPNKREEIPTPSAAYAHSHLKGIAHKIPPFDSGADILLLLGRDILRVHKVRSQINGPHNAPYAQKLDLGWVIIGDVCLGNTHKPSQVSTFKTHVLSDGRPTHFSPCESHFTVKPDTCLLNRHLVLGGSNIKDRTQNRTIGNNVFCQTKNDNKLAWKICSS